MEVEDGLLEDYFPLPIGGFPSLLVSRQQHLPVGVTALVHDIV